MRGQQQGEGAWEDHGPEPSTFVGGDVLVGSFGHLSQLDIASVRLKLPSQRILLPEESHTLKPTGNRESDEGKSIS